AQYLLGHNVGPCSMRALLSDSSPKSDTDSTSRRQTRCSRVTLGACGRRKRHDIQSPGPEVLISPAFSAADPERRRRMGDVARVAVSAPLPGAKRGPCRADDVGDAHHPGADVV